MISGGQLWGGPAPAGLGDEALSGEEVDFAELVSDHLGAALHTADLYRRLDQAYLGTAEALAAALEAKDDYTADHARSIADLAVAVGRELDLDEQHLRDLRYGAIFHDIGKIAIPDAILNKPAPLTREECEVIETHPIAGEQILAPSRSSPACAGSSATTTSAGTARATRTGCAARRSRSARASSSSWTPSTRWCLTGRTARGCRRRRARS